MRKWKEWEKSNNKNIQIRYYPYRYIQIQWRLKDPSVKNVNNDKGKFLQLHISHSSLYANQRSRLPLCMWMNNNNSILMDASINHDNCQAHAAEKCKLQMPGFDQQNAPII